MMIALLIGELQDRLATEAQVLVAVRAVVDEFDPIRYDEEDDAAYSGWCIGGSGWALDYIKSHPDWFKEEASDEARAIIDKYRAAIVKEYGEGILRLREGEQDHE